MSQVSSDVQKLADKSNVLVKNFNVIYHLIGDLRVELGDRMEPVEVRVGVCIAAK